MASFSCKIAPLNSTCAPLYILCFLYSRCDGAYYARFLISMLCYNLVYLFPTTIRQTTSLSYLNRVTSTVSTSYLLHLVSLNHSHRISLPTFLFVFCCWPRLPLSVVRSWWIAILYFPTKFCILYQILHTQFPLPDNWSWPLPWISLTKVTTWSSFLLGPGFSCSLSGFLMRFYVNRLFRLFRRYSRIAL